MGKLVLDGNSLRVSDIWLFCRSSKQRVHIAPAALRRVKKAAEFVRAELGKKIIYGVNTGFGPMASHIIQQSELVNLQKNLIRSHAVGMGDPIGSEYVLAAMLVRLNVLLKGYSGVTPELVERLQMFINRRVLPVVPDHGAVGTSGDLVQLAHIALALIGEGEVFLNGERMPAGKAHQLLKILPYVPQPKEGLALVNGTSMMTGIGALLTMETDRLLALAVRAGALALEIVGGFGDGLSERLHAVRPHRGQQEIARVLRMLTRRSKRLKRRWIFQKNLRLIKDTYTIPEDVQEFYSLRCIPQIVGPVFETFRRTQGVMEIEMNAATDNPIVDLQERAFRHGGNFHGDAVALALDQLKIGLVKLTMLSERRINFFLNQNINRRFPPFLNLKRPGLTLGLQGLQFVATSTAARSQTLAFPQYVHSIPTNADNQDIVSMGTDAALLVGQVVENAYIVQAIELLTLAQAVDYLKMQHDLSVSSRKLYEAVRRAFPKITDDRVLVHDLPHLLGAVRKGFDARIGWEV
jgi:histidine ammonia-lyase